MLVGPVHGGADKAELYQTRSGKLVDSWRGKGVTPQWAKGWEGEFGAGVQSTL